MQLFDRTLDHDAAPDLDAAVPRVAPGKRTLTQAFQRRHATAGTDAPPHAAHAAAPIQRAASAPSSSSALDDPFGMHLLGPVSEGTGRGLPTPVRAQMEHAFGTDFGAVRLHEDGAASALGALAYAQGDQLHFAPGQLDVDSRHGQELLGHELAHVVQQRQGRVAAPQGKGAPINADAGLEHEADVAGAAAAAGDRVSGTLAGASARSVGDAAIQRKVGFELEINILLSRGGRSDADQVEADAGAAVRDVEPPLVSKEDLETGAYSDPDTLVSRYGPRMVMFQGKNALLGLRWEPTSVVAPPRSIKPAHLGDHDPGRWVLVPTWNKQPDNNGNFFDPHLNKSDKVFEATSATPFDVVEDHVAQPLAGELGSIIELVTVPQDETPQRGETAGAARARFLRPVERAVETVRAISSATDGLSKRIPAGQVFAGARRDLYLGWNGHSNQTLHASLQATFGIELAGVPTMMEDRLKGFDLLREPGILEKAMTAAAKAAISLGLDGRHDRLKGLLHLISMYLVAGSNHYLHLCSLDKNHVPYLIRHGLPSIRNSGLAPVERELLRQREPAPKQQLSFLELMDAPDQGPSIIDEIARAADRSSSEPLFGFARKQLTVEEWIRAALYGAVDPLMDDFWGEAKEIAPEEVGPEKHRDEPGTGEPLPFRRQGVILEQRHAAPGPQAPDRWVDLAATYFDSMPRYNR